MANVSLFSQTLESTGITFKYFRIHLFQFAIGSLMDDYLGEYDTKCFMCFPVFVRALLQMLSMCQYNIPYIYIFKCLIFTILNAHNFVMSF